ncbi:hypothetical protein PLICRDRAFT_123623 [Plicaturopsis crispa FD-325 SS-3]|nr:hypothetical protein PLICRDRAFT_123623 [Plicaturopsis crispa FD-325 SS-3]
MRDVLAYRKPQHRRGFYIWMLLTPLTAPLKLIPIIPNLPFFYCVWRSWCHWRAYKASQYLETLVGAGAVVPEASQELDQIYDEYKPKAVGGPHASLEQSESSLSPETGDGSERTRVLLTRDAVPAIISLLGLPQTSAANLYRAVEQARIRVEQGKA